MTKNALIEWTEKELNQYRPMNLTPEQTEVLHKIVLAAYVQGALEMENCIKSRV